MIKTQQAKETAAKPTNTVVEQAGTPKAATAPTEKKRNGQVKKPKLKSDQFTMLEAEYKMLGDVKKACIKAGFPVKKNELLQAGIALIKTMDLADLKCALAALPRLEAGRAKKGK
jgi:hypothetical protein